MVLRRLLHRAGRSAAAFCLASGTIFVGVAQAASPSEGADFFEAKIRPVLIEQCYKCHSAESGKKLKAGLLLDSRDSLLKGGDSGPAVVPGDPEKSLLIKAIRHTPGEDLQMPPKTKLTEPAIADLTAWVKAGASWPKGSTSPTSVIAASTDYEKIRREHWAYQPLSKPVPPPAKDAEWARTPIDAFVLAKLDEKSLKPNPPADKRTLLRRVYLDLIGLPPSVDEQRKFLDDSSSEAFEKVVDDLLARPQYGERWGRHWLDVARYAETQGYERDEVKKFAWRYRDYVIKSFNDDKPYDRFVTEQLAGDEIDGATAETQSAVSFLAVGTFDTIAADATLARYDQMDDVVGTTASVFLGQTVRCARCHDHKFEPISQTDYYRLLSVFEPLKDRAEPVQIGSAEEIKAYREATASFDQENLPRQEELDELCLKIFDRIDKGQFTPAAKEKRAKVPPAELYVVLKKPAEKRNVAEKDLLAKDRKRVDDYARRGADDAELKQIDRLTQAVEQTNAKRPAPPQAYVFTEKGQKGPLAKLFIRGDHDKPGPEMPPGVPTVLCSGELQPVQPTVSTSGRRLWLARWMTGPGKDLLARVMVNRIWQYHFGRGIVATSNDLGLNGDRPSHRELLDYLAADFIEGGWKIKRLQKQIVMSSVYQTAAAYDKEAEADPENRLLWHWPTRRLEAEVIRDSMLSVSGKLNLEMYGPPIYPPMSQKVVGDSAAADWGQSDERTASRRSVYVFQKRSIPLPELEVMGMADSNSSTDQRTVATTSLQALMLLNSRFAFEQATAFAERVKREAGDDPASQVTKAYEIALGRPPGPEELAASVQFIAGGGTMKEAKPGALPALTSFCLVLMNTNEFVYMN